MTGVWQPCVCIQTRVVQILCITFTIVSNTLYLHKFLYNLSSSFRHIEIKCDDLEAQHTLATLHCCKKHCQMAQVLMDVRFLDKTHSNVYSRIFYLQRVMKIWKVKKNVHILCSKNDINENEFWFFTVRPQEKAGGGRHHPEPANRHDIIHFLCNSGRCCGVDLGTALQGVNNLQTHHTALGKAGTVNWKT